MSVRHYLLKLLKDILFEINMTEVFQKHQAFQVKQLSLELNL
jgi:hypothetical protein